MTTSRFVLLTSVAVFAGTVFAAPVLAQVSEDDAASLEPAQTEDLGAAPGTEEIRAVETESTSEASGPAVTATAAAEPDSLSWWDTQEWIGAATAGVGVGFIVGSVISYATRAGTKTRYDRATNTVRVKWEDPPTTGNTLLTTGLILSAAGAAAIVLDPIFGIDFFNDVQPAVAFSEQRTTFVLSGGF